MLDDAATLPEDVEDISPPISTLAIGQITPGELFPDGIQQQVRGGREREREKEKSPTKSNTMCQSRFSNLSWLMVVPPRTGSITRERGEHEACNGNCLGDRQRRNSE